MIKLETWRAVNKHSYHTLSCEQVDSTCHSAGLSNCKDIMLIHKAVNISMSDSILDVGLGSGRVLNYWERQGFVNIYGIEIQKHFIDHAASGHSWHHINGDFLDYSFDNTFDLITMVWSLLQEYSTPDQSTLIAKGISLLSSKGTLVVDILDKKTAKGFVNTDSIQVGKVGGKTFYANSLHTDELNEMVVKNNGTITKTLPYITDNGTKRTLSFIQRV